jgi:hypothetical protein
MKALPYPRWRLFVTSYCAETYGNNSKNNYGAQARAARAAGYGSPKSTPRALAHIGWRLMRDSRIIEAIAEEAGKRLHSLGPLAVKTVEQAMGSKTANDRDKLRAADMVLGRVAPVQHQFEHTVKHELSVRELEALTVRLAGEMGVAPEKLLGANTTPLIEGEVVLEAEPVPGGGDDIDWDDPDDDSVP